MKKVNLFRKAVAIVLSIVMLFSIMGMGVDNSETYYNAECGMQNAEFYYNSEYYGYASPQPSLDKEDASAEAGDLIHGSRDHDRDRDHDNNNNDNDNDNDNNNNNDNDNDNSPEPSGDSNADMMGSNDPDASKSPDDEELSPCCHLGALDKSREYLSFGEFSAILR